MIVDKELVRRMIVNTAVSEKVINAVLSHQIDSIGEALKLHDTVEISGFGKFILSPKKVKKMEIKIVKRLEAHKRTLSDENLPDERRKITTTRNEYMVKKYNELKQRTYELERNSGGLEKQHLPSQKIKEGDRTDFHTENESVPCV